MLDVALEVAIDTAREAGELLCARREEPYNLQSKGLRDVVTDVDLEAQALISERLLARFPDHAIWAEEGDASSAGAKAQYTWIVDPLDGTNNYSRRLPTFSVSIALAQGQQVLLGAVYEPLRDYLFHCRREGGAFLNGRQLQVSQTSEWDQAIVACDWAHEQPVRRQVLDIINQIAPEIYTVRTLGSAALGFCYVAAGWLDAYFSLRLNPWDIATGALLVQEAGGRVTSSQGKPWRLEKGGYLASNGALHRHLVAAALKA